MTVSATTVAKQVIYRKGVLTKQKGKGRENLEGTAARDGGKGKGRGDKTGHLKTQSNLCVP